LDDVVNPVTVMETTMHLADESCSGDIIRCGEEKCVDKMFGVPEPIEEAFILFHHSECHGTRDFDEENDRVVIGVSALNVFHFFHVCLHVLFGVRNVGRFGDRSSRRSIFGWEEVKCGAGSTRWCWMRSAINRAF
jgi:hypothetical protein